MTDGTQALEELRERDFDAVLSDIYMTGMSGIELCTSLSVSHPNLSVLVMTGQGSLESAIAAIRAGARHSRATTRRTSPVEPGRPSVDVASSISKGCSAR